LFYQNNLTAPKAVLKYQIYEDVKRDKVIFCRFLPRNEKSQLAN